jgi:hypothetical protein
MKLKEIRMAIGCAEDFLAAARDAIEEYKSDQITLYPENKYDPLGGCSGTARTGALRRASMDLTRQLAKMRKP